jgi:hypothetical protein
MLTVDGSPSSFLFQPHDSSRRGPSPARGDYHWVIALAYFCMGRAMPSVDPVQTDTPYWMRKKQKTRKIFNRV